MKYKYDNKIHEISFTREDIVKLNNGCKFPITIDNKTYVVRRLKDEN